MGIFQEVLYKRYGKHPREALFFTVSIILIKPHSNISRIRKHFSGSIYKVKVFMI